MDNTYGNDSMNQGSWGNNSGGGGYDTPSQPQQNNGWGNPGNSAPPPPQQTFPQPQQNQPQQPSWRESFLPEHLKNEPFFSRFDSPEKFAESALNAHKFVGRKLSDIPLDKLREMFSPEDMAQYHQARGVPENPDGYEIQGLPEEITQMPQVQKAIKDFQGVAHKLGMPAEVAQELVKFEYQMHQNAIEETRQQNFTELSNRYGRNLEGADRIATEAVRSLGGQELVSYMKNAGLAANPKIFDAFYKLGQMMQNDRVPMSGVSSGGMDSSVNVKTEIQKLYNDPQFYRAYKENNPQAHDRINSLYKRLQQLESGR